MADFTLHDRKGQAVKKSGLLRTDLFALLHGFVRRLDCLINSIHEARPQSSQLPLEFPTLILEPSPLIDPTVRQVHLLHVPRSKNLRRQRPDLGVEFDHFPPVPQEVRSLGPERSLQLLHALPHGRRPRARGAVAVPPFQGLPFESRGQGPSQVVGCRVGFDDVRESALCVLDLGGEGLDGFVEPGVCGVANAIFGLRE